METYSIPAVVLSVVFFLGAAVGALLISLYRATQSEQIKAEFVRQLEERVPAPRQPDAHSAALYNRPVHKCSN